MNGINYYDARNQKILEIQQQDIATKDIFLSESLTSWRTGFFNELYNPYEASIESMKSIGAYEYFSYNNIVPQQSEINANAQLSDTKDFFTNHINDFVALEKEVSIIPLFVEEKVIYDTMKQILYFKIKKIKDIISAKYVELLKPIRQKEQNIPCCQAADFFWTLFYPPGPIEAEILAVMKAHLSRIETKEMTENLDVFCKDHQRIRQLKSVPVDDSNIEMVSMNSTDQPVNERSWLLG